ncbi:hypothetical protein CEXT_116101 [Caerostris extrusa]|uniref:Uncharacterized protein n=1 Tax=Caerostris extrusa TaxID=172846 RepID=A0AAV4MZW8_CAEEX|nr:hypothetical protein CEXT_116101 [Caerostris extrusa]
MPYILEFLVQLATETSPKTTPLRWSSAELTLDCLARGLAAADLPIMVIWWCWWKVEFLWVVDMVSVMVLYSEAREVPSCRGCCMEEANAQFFAQSNCRREAFWEEIRKCIVIKEAPSIDEQLQVNEPLYKEKSSRC